MLVADYIGNLVEGSADGAWDLLHPATRLGHFPEGARSFAAIADQVDWSHFEWRITDVEEDEPGSFEVAVSLSARDPAPQLISQLGTFMSDGSGDTDATFYVKFDQLGGTGIYEPGT